MGVTVKDQMGVAPRLRRQFDGQDAFTVRALAGTVGFGDHGTPVDLGQLPAGTVVLAVVIAVTEAFDDSGTDLIDVGTGTDPDGFVVDFDASSTGSSFEGDGALIGPITTTDTVEVLYTGQNDDASAGSAEVAVLYLEA